MKTLRNVPYRHAGPMMYEYQLRHGPAFPAVGLLDDLASESRISRMVPAALATCSRENCGRLRTWMAPIGVFYIDR